MQLKDLKANKKNPRKISPSRLKDLSDSMKKYGDLSGTVFNIRTKALVGGHQRTKTFGADAKIVIEKKYDTPTKSGTVSEGFIESEGEKFKYREVDWDEQTEVEALLAANAHGGEWDSDILKLNIANFPKLDTRLSGLTMPALKSLNITLPKLKEETDAQYVKNNPGPNTEAERERLPSMVNTGNKPSDEPAPSPVKTGKEAFESIEETRSVIGKRFTIIIDCPSEELKQEIRKLTREIVEEKGGKFF